MTMEARIYSVVKKILTNGVGKIIYVQTIKVIPLPYSIHRNKLEME